MKDIIEDPARWGRKAAGTPARAVGTLACHLALVVLGYLLDQQALMVVAGVVLPALHLYSMNRMANDDRLPGGDP